jgi:hypothetical protein
LACVTGVSGADLKQRIERIVMSGVALPLGAARKLLLAGFAGASLIVPLSASLLMAPLVVAAAPQPQPAPTPERIAELRAEQAMPRKQVAFDPKDFDKFTGTYQFGPAAIMTVTRDGSHFLTRLTGQVNVEVFPESQTKFFTTNIPMPAQISFDSDTSGRVTGMVLHQNGLEQHAPRVSAVVVKAIEDALAARIKSNKPSPGTEASLRRYIDSLEKGAPNYEEMTPAMANVVRKNLSGTLATIKQLGTLKSLNFMTVNGNGADVYDVVFEHGRVMWFISPLTADGKVAGRGFQRLN